MRFIFALLTLLGLSACGTTSADWVPQGSPVVFNQNTEEAALIRRGGRTTQAAIPKDSFTIKFKMYRTGGTQTSIGQGVFGRGWYGRTHTHPRTGKIVSVWLYRPDGFFGYIDTDVLLCRQASASFAQVPYDCTF